MGTVEGVGAARETVLAISLTLSSHEAERTSLFHDDLITA